MSASTSHAAYPCRARWALFIAIAIACAFAHAADVPYLSGCVVDNAEILKPQTVNALTGKLKAHEQKTTNQIAVLTVSTIGDESIEAYATRVFELWKLGQKVRTTACCWSSRRRLASFES